MGLQLMNDFILGTCARRRLKSRNSVVERGIKFSNLKDESLSFYSIVQSFSFVYFITCFDEIFRSQVLWIFFNSTGVICVTDSVISCLLPSSSIPV